MLVAVGPRHHTTGALAWRGLGAEAWRVRPRSRNRLTRCPRPGRLAAVDALVERAAGRPRPLRHCRQLGAQRDLAARPPARAAVTRHGAVAESSRAGESGASNSKLGSKTRRRDAAAVARRLLGLATSSRAWPRSQNQRRDRPLATSTLLVLLALPVRVVRLRAVARQAQLPERPPALRSLSWGHHLS